MAEAHTFGRYRVTKALGSGAMGDVFEALDDVLGREVAIKTLRTGSGAVLLDDRFHNEARAIAKLSHPNIVHIFDVDIAASPPYLVMEEGITGAASDVYGLGATLYEAAAGTWPRLEAKGALLAPVPPLATLAPAVPPHVCAAIDRAVAFEHAQRPTAAELAQLLASGPQTAPPRARHRAPWLFAGGAALALALGLAIVATRPHDRADTPPAANEPPTDELQSIADQANGGDVEGARERLDDYEQRAGETPASRDLRHQLDRLLGPGKHRGPKHGED